MFRTHIGPLSKVKVKVRKVRGPSSTGSYVNALSFEANLFWAPSLNAINWKFSWLKLDVLCQPLSRVSSRIPHPTYSASVRNATHRMWNLSMVCNANVGGSLFVLPVIQIWTNMSVDSSQISHHVRGVTHRSVLWVRDKFDPFFFFKIYFIPGTFFDTETETETWKQRLIAKTFN